MTSDEALMLEFQGGSRAAFEELFARYRKPLCGFFGRRLNNPERAEDLTQGTFLAVICSASRYEPRASVRTYLYGIALKLLAAERRKVLTSSTSGQRAAEPKTGGTPECVLWVRQAMEKLDGHAESAVSGRPEPITEFTIAVGKWSDGTAAPVM